MPILDIQRRLTQLGVIRLGRQVPTGKTNARGEPTFRPEKLDRFRITAPDENLVTAVADKYGGTPAAWRGPSGPEWEVITDAKAMPVLVPPQRIDPNYEQWGKGFRARLCDGETERLRGAACLCVQGPDGHAHDFVFGGLCECGVKRECKPTTRLSLMLAEIPGLGVWKLESHGRNAAAELPMTSDALETAPGPVPATLVVHFVEKKILLNAGKPNEKIEPRSFYVPRLVFDFVTPQQAFSGQLGSAARAALTGVAEERQAIGATPASAPQPSVSEQVDFYQLARDARDPETVRALWKQANQAGALDEPLAGFLKGRVANLTVPDEPVGDVVDAEMEPDRDATWFAIVGEADKHGYDQPGIEAKYRERMGHDPIDDAATGWKLTEFLTALKSGDVK